MVCVGIQIVAAELNGTIKQQALAQLPWHFYD
jgi:hypothetical protein